MPHDALVAASLDIFTGTDPNRIRDQVNEELNGSHGPLLQHYVRTEESFREEHQVESDPVPPGSVQIQGSDGKLQSLSPPLTRIQRDDFVQIQEMALHRMYDKARFKRQMSFRLIGIRPEYNVAISSPTST